MALIDHVQGIVDERNGRPISVFARRGNQSSSSLMDWLDFKPLKVAGGIEEALAPSDAMQFVRSRMERRVGGATGSHRTSGDKRRPGSRGLRLRDFPS